VSALLLVADALEAQAQALRALAQEQGKPEPEALAIKYVAQRLGVSVKAVYQYIAAGQLPAVRRGKRGKRVELVALEAFEKRSRI
jgi:excisionase family DNA binding protein